MAKAKEKVTSGSGFKSKYHSASDMPWEDIEAVAKRKFTSEERTEVFKCTIAYSAAHHRFKSPVTVEQFYEARTELSEVSQKLVDFAGLYETIKPDGSLSTEAEVAWTLNWLYPGVQDNLLHAAYHLKYALASLAEDRPPELETTRSLGHKETLGAFLLAARRGADEGMAPSKEAKEYHRWGVRLGPKSKECLEFCNAVLGESFSKSQLRQAWDHGVKPKAGTDDAQF